jgi:hypothetical protein
MGTLSQAIAIAVASLLGGCFGGAAPTTEDVSEHATGVLSDSGRVTAEVQSDGPIAEGENDLLVRISPASGASIERIEIDAVSALMPAHAHATEPARVTREGDAHRIHDLPLTMPGRWEITLKLREDDAPDSLRFGVEVP